MEGFRGVMIGDAGGTEAEGHTTPTQTIWILGVVGAFPAIVRFAVLVHPGA